ncbi:MAG TPA: phospholipase D family protein [Burkholderiales bacterium]|nr:phospholipase D family protein [Burkholderiales bacterium]
MPGTRVAAWMLTFWAVAAGPGGGDALAREPQAAVPATGTIEYAFSPGDDVAALVVRAIDDARAQVLVQAFTFTHDRIAEALLRAGRRGVDVRVLLDREQTELLDRDAVRALAAAGFPVLLDGEHLAAHNKVLVIDATGPDPVVVTGSFNFTFAAQYRNAENLLVLRGNPALAGAYRDNWEKHGAHSKPMAGKP